MPFKTCPYDSWNLGHRAAAVEMERIRIGGPALDVLDDEYERKACSGVQRATRLLKK